MRRVIGVGVDSGSIGLIEELVAAGSLPHLAALRERSARVPLRCGTAYRHGLMWPQFVAGAEAQLDGAWHRLTFDPSAYEAHQHAARHLVGDVAPFWEPTEARTVTLDVPHTTVSGSGVHVTAWGAHAPHFAHASRPPGLLRELDARFGVHPAFENDYACGWHDPKRLDRLTDALVTGAHRRAEIALELMRRYPDWQLFLTSMSEAHSSSELMWHGIAEDHPLSGFDPHARSRLERVFRGIDDAIGEVVAHAPDDAAIVVFSLDGMQTSHGDLPSIVLLPELLHRREFGTPLLRDLDTSAWRRAGCPPVIPHRGRPWRPDLDARLVDPPRPRWSQRVPGYQAARLTGPGRRVLERIKHARLGALGVSIPPEASGDPDELERGQTSADRLLFIDHYRPYRSEMRAFALPSFSDGFVRVNLVGRERDGIVPIDELDAELRAVESMIRACRDVRTGQPIASEIRRLGADDPLHEGRECYGDLVIEWSRPIDALEHPDVGVVGPYPFNRTGFHHSLGFAWVSADGLAPGDLAEHSVLDLPPTIVRLLDDNAPLPPEGTPISELTATGAPR